MGLTPRLPNELVHAAQQQEATSWYQAQAAQGAIFAHKCEALRNVAETVRAIEGMQSIPTEEYRKLDAILKRGIGGVESDQFYRQLLKCNKFSPHAEQASASAAEEEGD